MTANPNARKCGATTATGRACRAWAIRQSDPPLCSAHAGHLGAPHGNTNAMTHGFYARAYTDQEIADLVAHAINESLDDEIGTARVALRRVLELLEAGQLTADEYAKLAGLAFVGSRTIGRLLRDRRALSGESADGIADFLSSALDEVATELGIDV